MSLVQNKIQSLVLNFIECLISDQAYQLKVPRNEGVLNDNSCQTRSYDKPSTCRKYCQLMSIAALVGEMDATSRHISQRDLFYALKFLFKNQNESNTMILECGLLLGLKRHEMRILTSARGLVAGDFSFRSRGDTWIHCSEHTAEGGYPISSSIWSRCCNRRNDSQQSSLNTCYYNHNASGNDAIDTTQEVLRSNFEAKTDMPPLVETHTDAKYLLIVEKQGIFLRLCEDAFHRRIPCILVTGCGYPDIATRSMVRSISERHPEIIVLGLADYNPHGFALLDTFKNGSIGMAYEGQGLQVPTMKWLGLHSMHIGQLKSHFRSACCALNFGANDFKKLRSLLKNEDESTMCPRTRQELLWMLQGGQKFELESLFSLGIDFLGDILAYCIAEEIYI